MEASGQAIIAGLLSLAMISIVVMIHHECLQYISNGFLARVKTPRRWHISFSVLLIVGGHVLEILFCAMLLYIAAEHVHLGSIEGDTQINAASYIYYSFSSYTSLGIGDLYPTRHLRLMTGIEALLGLLMIGWTASFLLLEMRQFWSNSK